MDRGVSKERRAVAAVLLFAVVGCSSGSGAGAGGSSANEDCQYAIGVADQAGNQTCSVQCIPYSVECARTAGGPAECTCSKGPKSGTTFSQADCDVNTLLQHCK